eukprot:888325-Pelagomonas_calceolata.AAC.8
MGIKSNSKRALKKRGRYDACLHPSAHKQSQHKLTFPTLQCIPPAKRAGDHSHAISLCTLDRPTPETLLILFAERAGGPGAAAAAAAAAAAERDQDSSAKLLPPGAQQWCKRCVQLSSAT